MDPLRAAAQWLITAITQGTGPDEVRRHVAERLTQGRDLAGALSDPTRFRAWRAGPVVLVGCEPGSAERGSFNLTVDGRPWQLDIAVEARPPHRIVHFHPRRIDPDAPSWDDVAEELTRHQTCATTLPGRPATAVHDALLAARSAARIPAIGVAITRGGSVVHRETSGSIRLGSPSPLQPGSTLPAGSTAKTVTALAILLLAERGELDLDRPLSDHIAGIGAVADRFGERPTVAQTLPHQGGFARDLPRTDRAERSGGGPLAANLPAEAMAGPPGGTPRYSTIGYQLLGELIGIVSRTPYQRFAREQVLHRLGMRRSWLQSPDDPAVVDVTGYHVVGSRLTAVPPQLSDHPAAGGLISTLDDLTSLALTLSLAEDRLVGAALARRAAAGPGISFAAGGFTVLDGLPRRIRRAGSVPGFTTDITADVATGDTISIVANASPPVDLRDLVRSLSVAVGGGRQ